MDMALTTFTPTGGSRVMKNPLPAGADQLPLKARTAAKQFEAYYVQQFLEEIQPPTDKDNMFSGGMGEEMFRHTLNEQMAKGIADQGGFGVGNQVVGQMIKRQAAEAYAKTLNATRSADNVGAN